MVGAKSKHKTCAYKLIDHLVSPKTNAEIAEYFGEAPANKLACQETEDPNHCKIYHADDEDYFSQGPLLEHPDHGVPGRSHRREVHRLRGVDQEVVGDPRLAGQSPAQRIAGGQMNQRRTPFALLAAPMTWLVVAYLGALGVHLRDGVLHHRPVHEQGGGDVHDGELPGALLPDLPAHHRAHAAHRRARDGAVHRRSRCRSRSSWREWHRGGCAALLIAAVLVPLWASYLVKAYAWRTMLQPEGVLDSVFGQHAGLRPGRGRADADLPVAAVHDPAGVLRLRAAAGGAPRGVGGPRWLGGVRRSAGSCCPR